MERTQDLFEKIEEYLDDKMTPEEIIAFEQEIDADPELKEEVEKHYKLHTIIRDQKTLDFKEKLIQISKEIKEEGEDNDTIPLNVPPVSSRFQFLKIAASFVLIFGLGALLWSLFQSPDNDLYAFYYKPYPVDDVTRGQQASNLDPVLKQYAKGNYRSVVSDLEKVVDTSQAKKWSIYLGNTYLNLGKEQKALIQFQQIEKGNLFYEEAQWYMALTYLKMKDASNAVQTLKEVIQFNGIYKDNATALLEEITEE